MTPTPSTPTVPTATITYRTDLVPAVEQVCALYVRAGLRRPVDDPDRIARMLKHANLTVTAWEGERLVGISRALSDFSYCTYLSDLAVDRAHQRGGVGRELIRLTGEVAGPEAMLLLLAAPTAMGYYPRVGFEAVANGWIIHRKA